MTDKPMHWPNDFDGAHHRGGSKMKLELYKPYRTEGGWKAVVVGLSDDANRLSVWHQAKGGQLILHEFNGTVFTLGNRDYDITSEWQEPKPPRTCEFWVNINSSDIGTYIGAAHHTKEGADELSSKNRIDCKRFVWTEGE